MPRFRAIIFDLDDTLYAEQTFVRSGFLAVAKWLEDALGMSAKESMRELWDIFKSGHRGNIFNLFLKKHGLESPLLIEQMVRVYRLHNPRIVPYPGVPELLARIRQRYALGLVSDGYLDTQVRKLKALGLSSLFDVVTFSDGLGRQYWKPSPIPFELTLQKLGIPGNLAVYVGDNPLKDFLGAKRAGMYTVRVRHPGGLYAHMEPPSEDHAPDEEIGQLWALESILQGVGVKES